MGIHCERWWSLGRIRRQLIQTYWIVLKARQVDPMKLDEMPTGSDFNHTPFINISCSAWLLLDMEEQGNWLNGIVAKHLNYPLRCFATRVVMVGWIFTCARYFCVIIPPKTTPAGF